MTDRALVAWAAGVLAAIALIYGGITWWFASPLMPAYFKAAIAILVVPLARLSAAPLALAWSRHR
jgi:hypothetical protein